MFLVFSGGSPVVRSPSRRRPISRFTHHHASSITLHPSGHVREGINGCPFCVNHGGPGDSELMSNGVTFRQRQRLCIERSAERGMGRQRVGQTGKSYGIPMEQHASNTPGAGWVLAGSAGAARRGPGEVPQFKSLPKLAGSGGIRRVARARPEGGSQGKGPGQRF